MHAGAPQAESKTEPLDWLDQHGDYLFANAMQRVGNRSVAEDLVQDTFLAAIQGAARFDRRSSVRTWLVGILRHKIADHFRRIAHERPEGHERSTTAAQTNLDLLERWTHQQFDRRGKWSNPPKRWQGMDSSDLQQLSPIEQQELRQVLTGCLDRLPPQSRQGLLLAEQGRLPLEKIGKILDASATNVGVMLHRARLALRHCLEVRWFGRSKGT